MQLPGNQKTIDSKTHEAFARWTYKLYLTTLFIYEQIKHQMKKFFLTNQFFEKFKQKWP